MKIRIISYGVALCIKVLFFSCDSLCHEEFEYPAIIKNNNLEKELDSAKWVFYFSNYKNFYGEFDNKQNSKKGVIYNLLSCELLLQRVLFKGDTSEYYFKFQHDSSPLILKQKQAQKGDEDYNLPVSYYQVEAVVFIKKSKYVWLKLNDDKKSYSKIYTDEDYYVNETISLSREQIDSAMNHKFFSLRQKIHKEHKDSLNCWLRVYAKNKRYLD